MFRFVCFGVHTITELYCTAADLSTVVTKPQNRRFYNNNLMCGALRLTHKKKENMCRMFVYFRLEGGSSGPCL